jgi:hypothetical protein
VSLTDAVSSLSDYLNQSIKYLNTSVAASSQQQKVTPDGQLVNTLTNQTSTSTQNSLAQNPIASTATDTVNATVTSSVQALVSTAITKVNLTPIENATTQFFTLFAAATSFGTEVAMAFARNAGNNVIASLAQKDAMGKQIQALALQLYNTCATLLTGQPFFNQYLTSVTQAYQLLVTADSLLKGVASNLAPGTLPAPFYQSVQFNQAITQLTQAQALLLPPNNTPTTNITGLSSALTAAASLPAVQTAITNVKNVYTAGLTIPGLTLQLAYLALQYEILSVNVNADLNIYLRALSAYISSYKQSQAVNQATIDHINSGTSQLDNLIAQMNQVLSQSNGSPLNIGFKVQLSSYGTIWGVKLTAIIAWLKANPGAGSALLTQTSASVTAYTKSINTINAMGNLPVPGGGTVYRTNGEEDALTGIIMPIAKFITTANLLVATATSKNDVHAQYNAINFYMQTAAKGDAAIVAAIQPFLNTKTTLTGPVNIIVQQMLAYSNKLGLDRIAGLLTNGDVTNLFAATPATSTYAGAAVTGMNSVIANLQALPNATTQQISQMQSLRDQVQRQQTAQSVYAGRSAASTQQASIAQQQQTVASNKTLVTNAKQAAAQIDSTVAADPVMQTSDLLAPMVTPGQLPDAPDTQALLDA